MNYSKKKIPLSRLGNIKSAIALVYNNARFLTVSNIGLGVFQGALSLPMVYLMKLVIDSLTAGVTKSAAAPFGRIGLLIALMVFVNILQVICRFSIEAVSEAQSQAITDKVMDLIHAKSVEVDLEFYENPRYYDSLHLAQTQAPSRIIGIVNGLAGTIQSLISLCAMAGLIFLFNWAVAALLFAAVIPGALVRLVYSGRMRRWYNDRASTQRKTGYLSSLLTGQGYAKEIRLFGLGSFLRSRFRKLRKKLYLEKLRISLRRSFSEAIAQSGAIVAMFSLFAYIAYRCLQGAITLGSLVMYYQAFQRAQANFKDVLASLTRLYEDSFFVSGLNELLALENRVASPARPRPFPNPVREGIKFDRVSFRYPAGTKNVLENVSFAISPGEHVALAGENGAGKTTIIKLLCRLYDPTSGRITVDGIDLKDFDIGQLRGQMGALFQDYAKYNMTVRKNIWLGDVHSPLDEESIEAAARFSGADGIIRALPRGYKTMLGRLFEEGAELSIGEWQKVALARAFLRNSNILILDEPTSALDARAEYEVFMRFHKLVEGRMAFFISHRFSTVRMADRIFMLHEGRIAESGSHEELIGRKGIYADLFEVQARSYR